MVQIIFRLSKGRLRPIVTVLTLFSITVGLVFGPFSSGAQSTSGTILGTIVDSNGAAIPNATIRAVHQGTGYERSTTSNEEGDYVLPALPIGPYHLEVEAQTFVKRIVQVVLQIEQRARVNIDLVAGALPARVEVDAGDQTPMVQTESGALGMVIDSQRISTLPLNSRQFLELVRLSSAAEQIDPGTSFRTRLMGDLVAPSFSVYGGRETTNYFTIDGVSANDRYFNSLAISPSIEAIEEFRVQLSNYSAEASSYGGPNINISTKSGTDSIHGSLYNFFRDDSLEARNPFHLLDTDGDRRADNPPFRRNQFGGSIGGPIIKSKAFYFGSYEGLKLRRSETKTLTVPTVLQRNGDFRQLRQPGPDGRLNTADDLGRVYNPDTKAEFATPNLIPRELIDPTSSLLLSNIPLPNLPGATRNYIAQLPGRVDAHNLTLRFDERINENNSVYLRLLYNNAKQFRPFGSHVISGGKEASFPGFGDNLRVDNFNLAAVWTKTFSPSVVTEARFGINGVSTKQLPENAGSNIAAQLGLQGLRTLPEQQRGYPSISITGMPSFGDIALNVKQRTHEYTGEYTVLWVKGNHSIKLGAFYRKTHFNPETALTSRGDYAFGGSSVGAFSGNALADFLLGRPGRVTVGDVSRSYFRGSDYALYAETDWQATRKLTLNLGLRYDFYGSMHEKYDRISTFDITRNAFIIPGEGGRVANPMFVQPVPGYSQNQIVINNQTGRYVYPVLQSDQVGLPRGLIRNDKNNFAPRVGFAYDIGGDAKTVLRGGYGIFYSRLIDSLRAQMSTMPPYAYYTFNTFMRSNGLTFANAASNLTSPPVIELNLPVDPRLRTGYVQQWNFTLERSFWKNFVVSASYIGNKGSKLTSGRLYNYALPGITQGGPLAANFGANPVVGLRQNGSFTDGPAPQAHIYGPAPWRVYNLQNAPGLSPMVQITDSGFSTYHGTTLRLQNRLNGSLNLDAAYTYGKSLDNDSLGLGESDQNPWNKGAEKARSSFDARHRFVSSVIYNLPFGRTARGIKGAMTSGWQLASLVYLESGLPFSVNLAGDYYGIGSRFRGRPDVVQGADLKGPRTADMWFNSSAFVLPPVAMTAFPFLYSNDPSLRPRFAVPLGNFGNAGRNILETDGIKSVNLGVIKNFSLTEKTKLQLRAEIFNLFNQTNYNYPNREFVVPSNDVVLSREWNRRTTNPDFGRVESTRTDMRQVQLGVKLMF
jgi:hypothetical protein